MRSVLINWLLFNVHMTCHVPDPCNHHCLHSLVVVKTTFSALKSIAQNEKGRDTRPLKTGEAYAQSYGHYDYGHVHHEHHTHYDHWLHQGGQSNHGDYHGGYHCGYYAPDHLTYPVHPPTYVYAAPISGEPRYVDSIGSDYGCPSSGYCPQAPNDFGQQYAPVPLHSQQDGLAFGPTQGLNDPSHDGHDHSGHNHAGHTHSNLGNAYASPSDPQDRSYVPAPSLNQSPSFQPAPPQPDSYSGIRPNLQNASPNRPQRREAPIRMDGPPPQL